MFGFLFCPSIVKIWNCIRENRLRAMQSNHASGCALSGVVATSYVWLFKFQLTRINVKLKFNSLVTWLHFKCLIGTLANSCRIDTEHFDHQKKFYWTEQLDKWNFTPKTLEHILYTHTHTHTRTHTDTAKMLLTEMFFDMTYWEML